jgi:glutamine synthetase
MCSAWQGDTNLLQHEPPPAPAAHGEHAPPPRIFKLAGSGDPALPGLCQAGEAFLAGVLRHVAALACLTSPAPNSYRRLAPHAWTGAFQCYGPNNREAVLRLCSVPGEPDAANAELKAFDAAANPHLAAAAIIGEAEAAGGALTLAPPPSFSPLSAALNPQRLLVDAVIYILARPAAVGPLPCTYPSLPLLCTPSA